MNGSLAGLGLEYRSLNTHNVSDIQLLEAAILLFSDIVARNINLNSAAKILHVAEGSLAHDTL